MKNNHMHLCRLNVARKEEQIKNNSLVLVRVTSSKGAMSIKQMTLKQFPELYLHFTEM